MNGSRQRRTRRESNEEGNELWVEEFKGW
jgi:hypothetical protein